MGLKYTITRAYSQKFGDYNKEWDSSSHTVEIPVSDELTDEKLKEISNLLDKKCQEDVQRSVRKLQERNPEQEAETELNFGLDLQDEQDRSEKLKEANKNLGYK